MNYSIFLTVLIAIAGLTNASTYGQQLLTQDNCLTCAKLDNYFCQSSFKGAKTTNPWDIQCCHDDDGAVSEYCNPKKGNHIVCSAKFSVNKGNFYKDCPR